MRFSLYLCSLTLVAATASAHEDKPYDQNGGHWDNSGFYHCHMSYCLQGPNRFDHRLPSLNQHDYDKYFLQEDWPYPLALNGCKTSRTIVLESTSKTSVTYSNPRQCEVREGRWIDEYTGEEFTRAPQLDMDHIIPTQYAHSAGGWQWENNKRVQFANDPLNLIAVGRDTIRKKRDRGFNDWQPRKEFLCEYARNWKGIADKYQLKLLSADKSSLEKTLATCLESDSKSVEEKKQ